MSFANQSLAYFEVFSPHGNKPLPFKVTRSKGVRREYDKGLKGTILTIEGVATQTKVQIPKDDRVSLQLTHPYLVLQVFALQGQPLYLEIIVTDMECSKFRLIFSSTVKETVHAAHHTKLPLNGIIWNKWLNLCFHMPQLIFDNFKQLVVRMTDAIILGPCRLRKIFTMRDVRDGIPTAMDFPPGTDHQSLLFCTNPTASDPSRPVSNPSDCVMTAQRRSLTSPPSNPDGGNADLRVCSSDSNRSNATQQSTPARDPLNSACSSAGSQWDGPRSSLWPAGSLGAAGNRPLDQPRGSSVDSCLSTPILKDPMEGSLFGFPRVKLTLDKKDSLEQLLTRTPMPKRLPALCVRTSGSPPSTGEDQGERYVAEPTSKSPWRMDREHKRVTFSASTKMEDGCSWSHLIVSPCTYDSLEMACEEELSYHSDEEDPEEEQNLFASTVHHTRAELLDQAAAAVTEAAKASPTSVSHRAPPGLAHLIRFRSPALSSTSDLASPVTPLRPLCFSPDDQTPSVIQVFTGQAPSPSVAALSPPSTSGAGGSSLDRMRVFAPSRYAPLLPIDPQPVRHLSTPLSSPQLVSPTSQALRLTTPRSFSLPSTPTRRVVDQDLLPLCRTSNAGRTSP